MLAVPAQVAGVERICLATPPPDSDRGTTKRAIDDSVLAAANLLGIGEVYCMGGSHAVAALACGTPTIPAVDFIAGPGSVYVQEAKRQLFGTVGVDGLYGPSEIAILADQSADPAWSPRDVLAQLEHDPGAAFVVSAHAGVLDRVRSSLERQIAERGRQEAIERGLREFTAFVLAADVKEACAIMNRIAPEHAVLAVADPHAVLDRVHNAGAYFLGAAPVASGDYYAGPSHCLPTGSTARFSSGCSVYTFLRRASLEEYPKGMTAGRSTTSPCWPRRRAWTRTPPACACAATEPAVPVGQAGCRARGRSRAAAPGSWMRPACRWSRCRGRCGA